MVPFTIFRIFFLSMTYIQLIKISIPKMWYTPNKNRFDIHLTVTWNNFLWHNVGQVGCRGLIFITPRYLKLQSKKTGISPYWEDTPPLANSWACNKLYRRLVSNQSVRAGTGESYSLLCSGLKPWICFTTLIMQVKKMHILVTKLTGT